MGWQKMLRRGNLTLVGTLLMFVGGVLLIVAGVGWGRSPKSLAPPQSFSVTTSPPTSAPATELPAATPTPEPSSAPVARIQIPAIGVNAPVVVLGVDSDGVMQSPSTPTDVGWYQFSAHPGFPGNAVFAGHVDFHPNLEAVFWRLRDVKPNDHVIVSLADGTSYTYSVVSLNTYSSATAPIQDIIGPTPNQVITLITCEGTFNTRTREYDKRLVVRAERIPG